MWSFSWSVFFLLPRLYKYFLVRVLQKKWLESEVLLCAVKVQNAVLQTEEVNKLRQAALLSLDQDVRLELTESSLSTASPLVDQGLELR